MHLMNASVIYVMYVYVYGCRIQRMYVCMYICNICMHSCTYVCMHVCMYVCIACIVGMQCVYELTIALPFGPPPRSIIPSRPPPSTFLSRSYMHRFVSNNAGLPHHNLASSCTCCCRASSFPEPCLPRVTIIWTGLHGPAWPEMMHVSAMSNTAAILMRMQCRHLLLRLSPPSSTRTGLFISSKIDHHEF